MQSSTPNLNTIPSTPLHNAERSAPAATAPLPSLQNSGAEGAFARTLSTSAEALEIQGAIAVTPRSCTGLVSGTDPDTLGAALALPASVFPAIGRNAPAVARMRAAPARRLLDFCAWPALPQEHACDHALAMGAWGEPFVRMKLLGFGLDPLAAGPGVAWDQGVLIPPLLGSPPIPRFVRLQTKTTSTGGTGSIKFSIRKGYHGSEPGVRSYNAHEFDLLALVSTRYQFVVFAPAGVRTRTFKSSDAEALRLGERDSFFDALLHVGAISPQERALFRRH